MADSRVPVLTIVDIGGLLRKLYQNKKAVMNTAFFVLVEIVGLEPMTFCMSSKRSNQLSYTSADCYYYIRKIAFRQSNLLYG